MSERPQGIKPPDNFVSGRWAPSFFGSSVRGDDCVYAVQDGRFQVFGDFCFISGMLVLDDADMAPVGTMEGNIEIDGLPVPAAGDEDNEYPMTVSFADIDTGLLLAIVEVIVYPAANDGSYKSGIRLRAHDPVTPSIDLITEAMFGDGAKIAFSGCYPVGR